jgi:hypothetical protein
LIELDRLVLGNLKHNALALDLMNRADAIYSYHLSGRRPSTAFVLVFFILFLFACVHLQVNWYLYVPCGAGALMAMWAIVANPQTGSWLSPESFYFYNGKTKSEIALADIAFMKVQNWTDGPDSVTFVLKDNKKVLVPSLCADSKLAPALRGLGVDQKRPD